MPSKEASGQKGIELITSLVVSSHVTSCHSFQNKLPHENCYIHVFPSIDRGLRLNFPSHTHTQTQTVTYSTGCP